VHHERLIFRDAGGNLVIYHADPDSRPLAKDAAKFALFCAAVAEMTRQGILDTPDGRPPDCLHLHDWYAALLLVLREYDPDYSALKSIRVAYTIHKLSVQ